MRPVNTFYLAGRWFWITFFGLMSLAGTVMLAALIAQGPDSSIVLLAVFISLTALLSWTARRYRVEIGEESLVIMVNILAIPVRFSDIEYVQETNAWRANWSGWSMRTLWLTGPVRTGLVLERQDSGFYKRIFVGVERRVAFLSALEARGVPVRRRAA